MEPHIRAVGILNIVWGALSVVGGTLLLLLMGGLAGVVATQTTEDLEAAIAAPVLALIGGFLFVLLVLVGVPSILAGWGVLRYREWGRILAIVVSAIHLLNAPFGTALGIYGLWALLSERGARCYEQLAARREMAATTQRG